MTLKVYDMEAADECFVGTHSHVNESAETDDCARRRIAYLRRMQEKGLRVKVAVIETDHVGFLYLVPIETSPWGPFGRDLCVIP